MVPGLYGLSSIIWGLLFVKMKCQGKKPSDQVVDESIDEQIGGTVEGIINPIVEEDVAIL